VTSRTLPLAQVLALALAAAGCGDVLPGGSSSEPATCGAAADCPGADGECAVRVCTAGTCGFAYAAAGTPVAAQTPGDCRVLACDGLGNVRASADDADVPDAGPCVVGGCALGEPTFAPVAAGTACTQGFGLVCDGAGACVGCLVAADCPGEDTACATRACFAGTCGYSYTPAYTPVLPDPVVADCRRLVCDGGSPDPVSTGDDADLPVDGNACTADVCDFGVPLNPPEPAGTACAQSGGTVCDGSGACVECLAGPDCPSGVCVAGVCAP
jgi:hypothetical protein